MPRTRAPQRPSTKEATEALARFGRDLTERARQGTFAPLRGRDTAVAEVFATLTRRRREKYHPVLIGEPEGDRLLIVREVARRIASSEVPQGTRVQRVIALDVEVLLSGECDHETLEARVRAVFEGLRLPRGSAVLFIDDLPQLLGAPRGDRVLDITRVLVPALGRREVQIIGAATLREYQRYVERAVILLQHYAHPIVVAERQERCRDGPGVDGSV